MALLWLSFLSPFFESLTSQLGGSCDSHELSIRSISTSLAMQYHALRVHSTPRDRQVCYNSLFS